jgi:hypothetical protein
MGSKNPDYGKKWALDELELKSRFYSFSKNNWKFIFFDKFDRFINWGIIIII